jgi:hypothetical protein
MQLLKRGRELLSENQPKRGLHMLDPIHGQIEDGQRAEQIKNLRVDLFDLAAGQVEFADMQAAFGLGVGERGEVDLAK